MTGGHSTQGVILPSDTVTLCSRKYCTFKEYENINEGDFCFDDLASHIEDASS